MKSQSLKLDVIAINCGTQIRAKINSEAVTEYAAAMEDAANKFPPVIVFHDGKQYILADGFHRVEAARRNGFKDILAEVHKGTKSDALRFALSANCAHGIPRTHADKRSSVEMALTEWPEMSDLELSRVCAVGNHLVAEVRKGLESNMAIPHVETRIGRDGKKRKPRKPRTPPAEDTRTTEEKQVAEVLKIKLPKPEPDEPAAPPKESAINLKTLQIVFEENLQPLWIKADKKTKREFIAWLK